MRSTSLNFFISIGFLGLLGCASSEVKTQTQFQKQSRLEVLASEFVIAKPLDQIRKEVLELVQEDSDQRAIATAGGSMTPNLKTEEVIALIEDESGYEGYRRISIKPRDRFVIVGKDRTYEGMRIAPNKSVIRVSNAQQGRLIREELQIIRKADPDGAQTLERRAEIGLTPPF